MTIAVRLAACMALVLALPAQAQESGDKARLDDFAVPSGDSDASVEQLDGDGAGTAISQPQASERSIAIPALGATAKAPMMQISQPEASAPAEQLTQREKSRGVVASSVSSHADSQPGAVVVLAGKDKCAPQLEAEQLEECERILEKRAAEFSAVEPPQLSAEQALLAERGEENRRTAAPSLMIQFASRDDPDAAIKSNQELASLYLAAGATPTENQPAANETNDLSDGVAQALGELVVTLGTQPQP